ncbi:thymidine phosphorylase [Candidatus Epulonipiscium fishelsonii]|uniref:Thymidine phosphorylase n=1 Tax=Candidatus Epulonipiscium fishelsonii TaxID=77094 RepID=A0ACC8XD72_9FIRM|nr:thymidine phosphorylase [Epulopiscium sp. SCG-B05WGA-EpuloA1]ONI40833.1 thymidine phosphorylase [Epulopiscium sp. SCG-B11WGA-EpuloA1]
MRIYDVIKNKRDGKVLSDEEIKFFVEGYTKGEIKDYQASALLMAIYFQGMNSKETATLTEYIAKSGDEVDLSSIKGIKVDKHSTGGVGDKTTLIVAPIVASCGVPVAKMSGRGLGHTGGTVDKMESIPNMRTTFTQEEFFKIVNDIGISVIGQSGNLAPADKKLYALRDVTATIDNISLISASIMSKKIAAGSDAIVLDIKTGSGAFMKNIDDAIKLAQEMVSIGHHIGRKVIGMITDMDIPLGFAIGNAIEVIESIHTLKGNGPKDLTEVSKVLATNMLYLAEKGSMEECAKMVDEAISSGRAFDKLVQMVKAQGGDINVIIDTDKFEKAKITHEVKATQSGYISHMDTEACGIASVMLGAGRETVDSDIDFSAGIILKAKVGDYVEKGQVIADLLTSSKDKLKESEDKFINSLSWSQHKPSPKPLIYAKVSIDGVKKY